MKVVHDFYSNLYTRDPECSDSQKYFLDKIDKKVSDEERMVLDKDFTPDEVRKALGKLQKKKSPGSDGLTTEFYVKFWSELEDLYFDCLKECEATGELTPSQKKGLIRVSYKKDGRMYIKHYRPITLLNVDVKILTRTLATRMGPVMLSIIHRNQTCLPGRNISRNTHILLDLIDVINMEGKGAGFILLDEEKAFDKMSHTFMIMVLRKFGFGERFINWIRILYTDIHSAVKVNGHLTNTFSIKRGVRQGCPLSSMLYVLCAEVLAIEIRTNRNIVGYVFNKGKDQHKITLFADDKAVCVTTDNSVLELFNVLDRYEAATNSSINKGKTVGIWTGTFRGKDKKFAGIDWKDNTVVSLGVYTGNDRALCAQTGFNEATEKIKLKMSYWKTKYMSLKGRIKILNIFILSKLWYILDSHDIPTNDLKSLNQLIKNFIWNGIHQVNFESLHDRYEEGGIGLQDISTKQNALRINWLKQILACDENHIEKHLANVLIGKHMKIYGLKILHYSNRFDKDIPSSFYRTAVKAWRVVFKNFIPGSVSKIKRDWIYENILLKDDDGRVFKPPSQVPPYAPEFICDLPVTAHPREFRGRFKSLIPKINKAFVKLCFSNKDNCVMEISTRSGPKDLSLCDFQTLYDSLLFRRKSTNKPWVTKWERENVITSSDWNHLWKNVHHRSLSQTVQSTLWELIHRNFMCAYFAKIAYDDDGVCKLCKCEQTERTHIFISCSVINEIYKKFSPLLINICPATLEMKEKIMGLPLTSKEQSNFILRNYVTSAIKHVVFKSRNKDFGNFVNTVRSLTTAIKFFLKNDLIYKWCLAKFNLNVQAFVDLYLYQNIMGKLDSDGELVLYGDIFEY